MPARTEARIRKAILVAVQLPDASDADVSRSLSELENLALGLGFEVVASFVQKRATRTTPAYLGEGKLREIAALTGGPGELVRGAAQGPPQRDDLVVIADDELLPGQLRALQSALGVEVFDRTSVILRVFEARARAREARLEIELARLQYELPRIRDDHSLGDREGGGGRAGRGHTNVELAKQRARERIAAIKRELETLGANAANRRKARADSFRVALVGYTNAGKSSIMHQLTGSDVLVEDKLFATLDTTVRQLVPPATPPILLADTVGFLERLPHALVASFRSTLAEAHEAWLLLHVVDASDPAHRMQAQVTARVLAELGADAPGWLVLNKIDRLDDDAREALRREFPDAIPMSALDPSDGASLRKRLVAFFAESLVEEQLRIPYAGQGVFAELRGQLQVVHEEYGEALVVTVRATGEVLGRLKKQLARFG